MVSGGFGWFWVVSDDSGWFRVVFVLVVTELWHYFLITILDFQSFGFHVKAIITLYSFFKLPGFG